MYVGSDNVLCVIEATIPAFLASSRISNMLLMSAKRGANGNAATNRVINPY